MVSDACWYLHLYDEEKKKIYEAHDAAMWEKYGRGIHAHEDAEAGKELSSKLFMSDKNASGMGFELYDRNWIFQSVCTDGYQ